MTKHEFRAFALAPEVCDDCGETAENHQPSQPSVADEERKRSLWRTLVRLGGPYGYYMGGPETCGVTSGQCRHARYGELCKAHRVRAHMEGCEYAWTEMREPQMDQFSVFAGTFAEHPEYVSVLAGHLTCRCQQYYLEPIVVNDLTVGQLIWHAVREGEL